MPFDVPDQAVGRLVTARPVLLQALHHDPVQVPTNQVDELGRLGLAMLGGGRALLVGQENGVVCQLFRVPFGEARIDTAAEQTIAWETQKARERADKGGHESLLDGVTRTLPALTCAEKLQRRAARAGFDWPDVSGVLAKIEEHGLPREAFQWYLDIRKYGTVPHGGFGMGIERCVAWVAGVPHIRETIPYPRTIYRIYP